MPLTGYKVTLFMQEGRFGGSETHYGAALTNVSAPNAALQLAKLRIGLMPASVSMFAVRYSNTVAPFDTNELDPNLWANQPKWQPGAADDPLADQAKAAIQVRCPTGRSRSATIFLFGTPDQVLGDETKTINQRVPASWLAAFNVYAAELKANWGTRVVTKPPPAPGAVPVLNFQNRALDGKLQVSVAGAPAGFAATVPVFLRNFTRENLAFVSANGLYKIVLVEANTPIAGQTQYTLASKAVVDASKIVTPGTIEVRDFTTQPYTDLPILYKITTRRRGNRFLAGLGRRKTPQRI